MRGVGIQKPQRSQVSLRSTGEMGIGKKCMRWPRNSDERRGLNVGNCWRIGLPTKCALNAGEGRRVGTRYWGAYRGMLISALVARTQKSLFTCHDINEEKSCCVFEIQSIVLQRTVNTAHGRLTEATNLVTGRRSLRLTFHCTSFFPTLRSSSDNFLCLGII